MSTQARRWPDHAENHRLDAMACLMDIETWADELDELISRGRTMEARHLVARMQKKAGKAKTALQQAKDAQPSPD